MSHELHRLTQKIKTEPQLITPLGLEGVLDYLDSRNLGEVDLAFAGGRKRDIKELTYVDETLTGVISVRGPLSYLEYRPICAEEVASYQRLVREFEAMADAGAKTVAFDFDTPGGQAYGCFESAKEVRRIADERGIKLVGYVDGTAASAGYAWLSVMHEKIGNPESQVGSIGVMVHLVNIAKARKALGIEDIYVYAGDSKIPWDKEGGLRKEFIDDLQAKVEKTYEDFLGHVSEYTSIEKDVIRNTKAKVLDADNALETGLLDAKMTRSEFVNYLADIADARKEGRTMSIADRIKTKAKKEETGEEMKDNQEAVAALQEKMAELQAKNEELSATVETLNETMMGVTEKLAKANKLVAEYEAKEKAAIEQAEEQKKATRLQKLEAVMDKEQAKEMSETLSLVPDAAFDAIVSRLQVAEEKEKEKEEFTELGVPGEGSAEEQAKRFSLVSQKIEELNKSKKTP